jgi:hypothetical protein
VVSWSVRLPSQKAEAVCAGGAGAVNAIWLVTAWRGFVRVINGAASARARQKQRIPAMNAFGVADGARRRVGFGILRHPR